MLKSLAQVVEMVDTLSWGGSGVSRAGSSPALGTKLRFIWNGSDDVVKDKPFFIPRLTPFVSLHIMRAKYCCAVKFYKRLNNKIS